MTWIEGTPPKAGHFWLKVMQASGWTEVRIIEVDPWGTGHISAFSVMGDDVTHTMSSLGDSIVHHIPIEEPAP